MHSVEVRDEVPLVIQHGRVQNHLLHLLLEHKHTVLITRPLGTDRLPGAGLRGSARLRLGGVLILRPWSS
jgi:hypothetical protein